MMTRIHRGTASFCLLLLLGFISACSSKTEPEPEFPTAGGDKSRASTETPPSSEAPQPEVETPQPAAEVFSPLPETSTSTIAEAAGRCQAVQQSRHIPVSCDVDYMDGMPVMLLGFVDLGDADRYLRPLASEVAAPFCAAAIQGNRRAQIIMVVAQAQAARHFECETRRWSSWERIDGGHARVPQRRRETPGAKALRVCQSVQDSHEIPMACQATVIDDVPSLIFGFGNMRDADQYLPQAARIIALPFCEAANQLDAPAHVYLQVGRRARRLQCSQGSWSQWVNLDSSSPGPSTPHHAPQPRTASAPPQLF